MIYRFIVQNKKEIIMKIQFLNGGLANQAFQYIFARYYELTYPGQVMFLDDTYFALNHVHNGYELEKVFDIKAHMLSSCFDEKVWNYILSEKQKGKSVPQILMESGTDISVISEVDTNSMSNFNPFSGTILHVPCNGYEPDILKFVDKIYYHGYWINKNWFAKYRDIFWEEFSFPELEDQKNIEYMQMINETQSLCIHVRRGDFVTVGWQMNTNVYMQLCDNFISSFGDDWNVFIFSDDIDYCRENAEKMGFNKFRDITFVNGNMHGKNYIDLQLMSNCKGMIMSNSSFSYLSALLDKKLVALCNPTNREV